MTQRERIHAKLKVLLRDYDYRYDGTTLINNSLPPYFDERVDGRFSTIQGACEWLIPIVADDEFSRRYRDVGNLFEFPE